MGMSLWLSCGLSSYAPEQCRRLKDLEIQVSSELHVYLYVYVYIYVYVFVFGKVILIWHPNLEDSTEKKSIN